MRKAREIPEEAVTPARPKAARGESDQRLRRLLKQAQRTSDARKKGELKEQFIREFYEGAR